MSEKLTVKNFGPLEDVELLLNRVTVLIGPQATGKSTLAKLISIFRDYKFIYKDADHLQFFKDYNLENYFLKKHKVSGNEINTYMRYESDNYTITFDTEFRIERSKLFDSAAKKEEDRIKDVLSAIENQTKQSDESEEVYRSVLLEIIKSNKSYFANIFLELIKESIYIPAERNLTSIISESLFGFISQEISLPACVSNVGTLFEKARKSNPELDIEILNIKYKFEDSINKVYYDKKRFVKLSESASGFQSVIPLFMILEYLKKEKIGNYSYVIEEPELNLYPVTQKSLVEYICATCISNDSDLVITTHSPYILSSFSNLLFAFQTGNKSDSIGSKVNEIINRKSWINPDIFCSYYVSGGSVVDIFDKETKLIGENNLDSVSEIIGDEFDKLSRLYK